MVTRRNESRCEDTQQFGMILLEMPEIYNSARKHLTFFGGGKMEEENCEGGEM